jgi:hypothetical protein
MKYSDDIPSVGELCLIRQDAFFIVIDAPDVRQNKKITDVLSNVFLVVLFCVNSNKTTRVVSCNFYKNLFLKKGYTWFYQTDVRAFLRK